MNILILIDFFILFWSIEVLASLQSGHSWEMTSHLSWPCYNDFYYHLYPGNVYGTKITVDNPDGIVLRVGQEWMREIGSSSHKVECERLSEKDYYDFDHYTPKLQVYFDGTNENKDKSDETIKTDNESDETNRILSYFTWSEREVWNCTSRERRGLFASRKSSEPINFYRVVNVMHGIRPINEIYYFDGLEVLQDSSPVYYNEDQGDHWTATFKEIKYFNPFDKTLLKYRGKLYLSQKDGEISPPPSIFEPIDVIENQPYDGKYRMEKIEYLEHGKNKTEIIDTQGEILRVGRQEDETLGSPGDEAVCTLEAEDESGAVTYAGILPLFDGKSAPLEKFSVNRQEQWKCTYQDGKFKRRLTELVVSVPVKEIQYYSGISVWKYRLNSNSYSVKIREVAYYKPRDNFYPIKFCGSVKLMKPKKEHHSEFELSKKYYKYRDGDEIFNVPQLIQDDYDYDDDDDLAEVGGVIAAIG